MERALIQEELKEPTRWMKFRFLIALWILPEYYKKISDDKEKAITVLIAKLGPKLFMDLVSTNAQVKLDADCVEWIQ